MLSLFLESVQCGFKAVMNYVLLNACDGDGSVNSESNRKCDIVHASCFVIL
jgi:hypothetical protein